MIEVILADRCTGCDLCVSVCPTDVFDADPGGVPVIARQQSCQTCFMCEAHCPVDALYVAPLRHPEPEGSPHRDTEFLTQMGVLGNYRARLGWGKHRHPPRTLAEAMALAADPFPFPRHEAAR